MLLHNHLQYVKIWIVEIFKTRDRMTGRVGPSVGRNDVLEQLLDYTTANFFPQVVLPLLVVDLRGGPTSVRQLRHSYHVR